MTEDCLPQAEVEEGAPPWMVTFGDLMSLLMCFFVLLLSFSEMDRKKYKMVSGSMKQAFGIQRLDYAAIGDRAAEDFEAAYSELLGEIDQFL